MRIGLHDAEQDHMPLKTFPNYAIMKISAFHKSLGDHVEWWNPLFEYDKVYSSKVFDFTPCNMFLPQNTIKGGTGYGLYDTLPIEIDDTPPDYTIYPSCDYAIGFLTRGCPNRCQWCYVPRKEGNIKPYKTWQEIIRPDTNKLVLMDNNILAHEHGIRQLEQLSNTSYKIDLNQGMDIRLLDDHVCEILGKIQWIKYIRFSCDSSSQLPFFEKALSLFQKHGISKSRVFIYTLVRQDLKEAEERIKTLYSMCKSFNVYAQPERNTPMGIVPTFLQMEFAQRYVYSGRYKIETWDEYKKRKGFK